MADDLFTLKEASRYTGASYMTIQKYYWKGDLPGAQTVGGALIFKRKDLDAIRPIIQANKERNRIDAAIETRRKKTEEGE